MCGGNNCAWIIILILILASCGGCGFGLCGNNDCGNNNCGCGC